MSKKRYLQVGCGGVRFKDTINLDISKNPAVLADVIADCGIIPFEDETFDGIIALHVLEHTLRERHESILSEWWRVLKPGGKLLFECPDFEKCLKAYLDNYKGLRDTYWYITIFGMGRNDIGESDRHVSGITVQYITDLLFKVGFCDLDWKESPESCNHNIKLVATKGEIPSWQHL